jgi:hypothetical protein
MCRPCLGDHNCNQCKVVQKYILSAKAAKIAQPMYPAFEGSKIDLPIKSLGVNWQTGGGNFKVFFVRPKFSLAARRIFVFLEILYPIKTMII